MTTGLEPAAAVATTAPVTTAFALGWHIAELYAGPLGAAKPVISEPPSNLPGLSELERFEVVELSLDQIGAELHILDASCTAAGIQLPEMPQSLAKRDASHRKALKLDILGFHIELLEMLTAADFRLGKAYGLGRALADSALLPAPAEPESFSESFDLGRIETLSQWLDDLETTFPPYAAPAARSSLEAWAGWVAMPTINGLPVAIADGGGDLTHALHKQGRLWRSLLSDEKKGVDLLTVDDYVTAAIGLVRRTSKIAFSFLRAWWWAALLLLGVALVIAWLVFTHLTGSSKTATAIISFLGLLGVTWKGVGASLGKVLERTEPPLWASEVKAAVCRAVTQLPTQWPSIEHGARQGPHPGHPQQEVAR